MLQPLTVAKLSAEKAIAQAKAVVNAVKDRQIDSQLQAMCCDTTSSNTGRLNGTCINTEQSLNKQLLFLTCRHHMLKLVIGAVFTACIGTSSGPDVRYPYTSQKTFPRKSFAKKHFPEPSFSIIDICQKSHLAE